MNLLWIDTETTGLDPLKHEVIDIAVIRTDIHGTVMGSFNSKVAPKHIETAEKQALQVNKYNEKDWKDAPNWTDVQTYIVGKFGYEPYVAAGWNIQFDLQFIRFPLNARRMKIGYHGLDLMGIGWLEIKHINKPHLIDLCTELNVQLKDEHTAYGDIFACVKCYQKLVGGK